MADPAPKKWYQTILDLAFSYVPSTITRDQAISIAGSIVKGIGWAIASAGWTVSPTIQDTFFGPQAVAFYGGLVLAVVPMIYDWYKHSYAGTLVAADKVPGVVVIETSPRAPAEVKAIAADPNAPKVVQASSPTP